MHPGSAAGLERDDWRVILEIELRRYVRDGEDLGPVSRRLVYPGTEGLDRLAPKMPEVRGLHDLQQRLLAIYAEMRRFLRSLAAPPAASSAPTRP
jgi:hypothetical protein